jgi:hypothetical protein
VWEKIYDVKTGQAWLEPGNFLICVELLDTGLVNQCEMSSAHP